MYVHMCMYKRGGEGGYTGGLPRPASSHTHTPCHHHGLLGVSDDDGDLYGDGCGSRHRHCAVDGPCGRSGDRDTPRLRPRRVDHSRTPSPLLSRRLESRQKAFLGGRVSGLLSSQLERSRRGSPSDHTPAPPRNTLRMRSLFLTRKRWRRWKETETLFIP